jgi:hypothetical protein
MSTSRIDQNPNVAVGEANQIPDKLPVPQKALRLWPGVVAVVLQWLLWFVVPLVARDAAMIAVLGGVALGLVVLIWWLFFSRAPWAERLGAILHGAEYKALVHQSIAGMWE